MTDVNTVVRQVQAQLAQAGIESAAAEASILVAHVLDVDRGRLSVLRALGETLDDATVHQIAELADARATRVPLQHLTGVAGFYGLDIAVEPEIFIPRVETEVLVEVTLEHIGNTAGPLTVLDLCTGTGAIAAALADQLRQRNIPATLWGVDLNPAAVELAQRNTAEYKATILCADATDSESVLQAAPQLAAYLGKIDVVVANPPYIPTTTPVSQAEAKHDPQLALYGGSADGTDIPLAIADQALRWLRPGGFYMMEHDHTHADQLAAALQEHPGWHEVTVVQDLTRTDRFISAIRTELPQPTQKSIPTLAQ